MKRMLLTFLITSCGMGLCSPVISAKSDKEDNNDRDGRFVVRLGLSGGETKQVSEGASESTGHVMGVGEFRLGYEFATNALLDFGIQGFTSGNHRQPGSAGQNSSSYQTSSEHKASLYSVRVGYRWWRWRGYGGFGIGLLDEGSVRTNDSGAYYTSRNDITGPVGGLGFILLKSQDVELELGADVSYLSLYPRNSAKIDHADPSESRGKDKILNRSVGLKFNLFTDGGGRRSDKRSTCSDGNTYVFLPRGSIRGVGELFYYTPQIALEVTKILIKSWR